MSKRNCMYIRSNKRGIYTNRITSCYCHYSDTCGNSIPGICKGQREGSSGKLLKQCEADNPGDTHVRSRLRRHSACRLLRLGSPCSALAVSGEQLHLGVEPWGVGLSILLLHFLRLSSVLLWGLLCALRLKLGTADRPCAERKRYFRWGKRL